MSLVAFATVLLIVKINLSGAAGTGVRAEDVVLALAVANACVGGHFRNYRLDNLDRALLVFVAVQVVAALIAVVAGDVKFMSALLFALRPFEYWLLRPLLVSAPPSMRSLHKLLAAYVLLLVVMASLQLLGFTVGTSLFSTERASGNTNGPYELAAVASGLFFFFRSRGSSIPAVACVVLLLVSASRITTVAVFALLLMSFLVPRLRGGPRAPRSQAAVRKFGLVIAPPVVGAALVLAALLGASAPLTSGLSRITASAPTAAWEVSGHLTSSDPEITDQADYQSLAYERFARGFDFGDSDPSSIIRFTRWRTIFNGWDHSPRTFFIGWGPSFAGVAVDGYHARVISEAGLLGLIALVALVLRLLQQTWRTEHLRYYVLTLIVSALFIDVFVSSKAVCLMWGLIAMSDIERRATSSREGLTDAAL